MQPSDRAAFRTLVSDVMAFYRQDVSTFALTVWWQACEGFDLQQVSKAMTAHAMDPERGQFAPKPADIVRQLQGTQTDRSLVAWGKVLQAMQRVGAYQSVVFDDPAIHSAIEDLGGWPRVCQETVEALPFLQRRFCESHRVHAKTGGNHSAKLIGLHEAENRQRGKAVAPPALVGDAEKCHAVLLSGQSQRLPMSVAALAVNAALAASEGFNA